MPVQHQILTEHEFDRRHDAWRVRVLLTLSGTAPATARVPLAMALVLDRSGSMAGLPIEAAREAAQGLITRLHPDDLAGVVLFDDQVETLGEPATGPMQVGLLGALAQVQARGSTNLSGGWLRGRDQMAALTGRDGVRRVLLLTDGQANHGITEPDRLAALARSARAQGITTSAIGFGPGYDEALLKGMADAGGGNLWHIERPDQAAQVFHEELGGLQSLAAQNLAVELRPGSGVASFTVVHDYPAHPLVDGTRLELGDLYAREPRRLLVEFVVPAFGEALRPDVEVARVQVAAHVLMADGGLELRVITFPVALTLAAQGATHPEVRREAVLLATARARDEAVRTARDGDPRGAARRLRNEARALRKSGVADEAIARHAADLEAMARHLEREGAQEHHLKYLAQRAYNQHRGKASYDALLSRPLDEDEAH